MSGPGRLRRRTLLGGLLAAVTAVAACTTRMTAAAAAPLAAPVAAGPVNGSGSAQLWRWVALPDTGGLQVYVTDATGKLSGVGVSWTFAGAAVTVVAAFPKPLTVTCTPGDGAVQWISSGAGYGLTVRRR